MKLDLARERRQIEETWGKTLDVKVDFVPPVGEEIRRRLRETNYHVIHYMGHGDFDDAGDGLLLLENKDRSRDPVTGEEFARWLADAPLRLVFLNACKTGMAHYPQVDFTGRTLRAANRAGRQDLDGFARRGLPTQGRPARGQPDSDL